METIKTIGIVILIGYFSINIWVLIQLLLAKNINFNKINNALKTICSFIVYILLLLFLGFIIGGYDRARENNIKTE